MGAALVVVATVGVAITSPAPPVHAEVTHYMDSTYRWICAPTGAADACQNQFGNPVPASLGRTGGLTGFPGAGFTYHYTDGTKADFSFGGFSSGTWYHFPPLPAGKTLAGLLWYPRTFTESDSVHRGNYLIRWGATPADGVEPYSGPAQITLDVDDFERTGSGTAKYTMRVTVRGLRSSDACPGYCQWYVGAYDASGTRTNLLHLQSNWRYPPDTYMWTYTATSASIHNTAVELRAVFYDGSYREARSEPRAVAQVVYDNYDYGTGLALVITPAARAAFLADKDAFCLRLVGARGVPQHNQPGTSLPAIYVNCLLAASLDAALRLVAKEAGQTGTCVLTDCNAEEKAREDSDPNNPPIDPDNADGDDTTLPVIPPQRLDPDVVRILYDNKDTTGVRLMIDESSAKDIARECRRLVRAEMKNPCDKEIPIYLPGSDVPQARDHRQEALTSAVGISRAWADNNLLYGTHKATILSRSWYRAVSPCNVTYDGNVVNCDEFPNWSTYKGYNGTEPDPSLKLIAKYDNQQEGSNLTSFTSKCDREKGYYGSPMPEKSQYFTVPVPDDILLPTFFVCRT